jgi:hypothetical protein
MVINNLTKLYNITCACFSTQDYFFKQNQHFIFEKPYLICTTLILMDSNMIKVWPYNTRTKVIINAQK